MRTIRVPLKLELGIERAIREAADEVFRSGVRAESVVAYVDKSTLYPASGLMPAPDAVFGLRRVQTAHGMVDVRFGPENCLIVTAVD